MRTKNLLTVGEKVKFFRQRAELTQMELELEANLGTGTINKIESGSNFPTQKTLHKIAITLDLDGKETAYLFEVNLYTNQKVKKSFRNSKSEKDGEIN